MKSRLVLAVVCLGVMFIQAGCATQKQQARRIEIPFNSPEEAESALALFSDDQVDNVAAWFPMGVDGCPGWETVDLSNMPNEALAVWVINWEHRIQDIKVHGCQSPLSEEDGQFILDIVKSVYFPKEMLRLEYIEGEEVIQAAWLASHGRDVRLPPHDLVLTRQELPINREIVRRINEAKGELFVDRVYVNMWIAHWNFY